MPRTQSTQLKINDILLSVQLGTRINRDDYNQLEALANFAGGDNNIDAIVVDVMLAVNAYPMTPDINIYTSDDNEIAYKAITTAIRKHV